MMIEKRLICSWYHLFWSAAKQGYYADVNLGGIDARIFAKIASVPRRFSIGENFETFDVAPIENGTMFSVWFDEFPAGDEVFIACYEQLSKVQLMLGDGPSQEEAMGLLSHSDEEVRAYALEHIAEWRKTWFHTVGGLSSDGSGTIKDETGRVLTPEEAAEHLRRWQEMTTPDAETEENMRRSGVADVTEQELIGAAKLIQKEVREEKRKR